MKGWDEMKGIFRGKLENCESYEGKNGFGANVTISNEDAELQRITRIEFNTRNKTVFEQLNKLKLKLIEIEIDIMQNKFGIRFGDVYNIKLLKV